MGRWWRFSGLQGLGGVADRRAQAKSEPGPSSIKTCSVRPIRAGPSRWPLLVPARPSMRQRAELLLAIFIGMPSPQSLSDHRCKCCSPPRAPIHMLSLARDASNADGTHAYAASTVGLSRNRQVDAWVFRCLRRMAPDRLRSLAGLLACGSEVSAARSHSFDLSNAFEEVGLRFPWPDRMRAAMPASARSGRPRT